MGKMDEQILVAPRELVFQAETLTFQGLLGEQSQTEAIMNQLKQTYREMRRGDAEEDPSFKQPIPYVVIRRGSEFFAYERLAGGGESRLHNKLSLGFGGHMNHIEADSFDDVLRINTDRELNEELHLAEADKVSIQTIGLINDDESEVGRVHIGILSVLDVTEGAEVKVKETEQIAGYWMSLDQLKAKDKYDRMETWSQFVVDLLAKE
ncbi:hypothetical protein [Alkalicoccobacillus porphyridii]|uniref:Nudix hydrolase domain-containing protein n=1 Tax=Alkalicoccobacillus porphyridii TaxID=2597270 RepID=A0A554A3X2_9BACI|nr:hypothetical protein [Alkalicoccobacillus porphyridii]TSB48391.1 hypothetical protein FN960_02225 [Alkalicoccobacillus porphyridii]